MQSPIGAVDTPVFRLERQQWLARAIIIADAVVIPAPVPVTPTVYPDSPDGKIIVHNHITINAASVDYKNFNIHMDALVKQLQAGRIKRNFRRRMLPNYFRR